METKQGNCPNCGAPIDKEALNSKKCPFCGGSLPQLAEECTKTKRNIKIDKIINFNTTEEEAKQKLALSFVDSKYDKELFVVNPEITAKKAYIPVWFFEVSYRAPWSCIKLVERASYNPNNFASERFTRIPMQGHAAESFTITEIASKNKPYPTVSGSDMEDFSQTKIKEDSIIYDINIDKDNAWNLGCIKDDVNFRAETAIKSQLPNEYEDLSWSVSYNYSRCYCVLVACWELTYEYNNKKYTCFTAGKGGFPFRTDGPLEKDAKKTESEQERFNADIEPRINLSLFGWSCFLLFLFAIGFGIYGLANNYPVILWPSALLAVLSCVWGVHMNILKQEEEDLIRKIQFTESKVNSLISKNSRQVQKDERFRYILSLNNPLVEPNIEKLRQQIGKIDDTGMSELNEQIQFYHNKLSAHKRHRLLYGLILSIITLITIVLGTSALNSRKQSDRAVEVQEEFQKQQEELLIDMTDEGAGDTNVATEEQVQEETSSAVEETVDAATTDEYTSSDNMWLAQRYASKEDIAGLSSDEIRILRNSIFARHGRYFKDPELQAYFNSQSWYSPYRKEVPIQELNEYEKKNIEFLKKHE